MDNLTALTLASIVFITTGLLLRFIPPGINKFYGYRTNASMANQENWDFSQRYSGRLFAVFGLVLFLIAVFIEYSEINVDTNVGKATVGVLILGSGILGIVLTEKAIKKNSKDKNV